MKSRRSFGSILDGFSKVLGKFWEGFGAVLDDFWNGFGSILVQFRILKRILYKKLHPGIGSDPVFIDF